MNVHDERKVRYKNVARKWQNFRPLTIISIDCVSFFLIFLFKLLASDNSWLKIRPSKVDSRLKRHPLALDKRARIYAFYDKIAAFSYFICSLSIFQLQCPHFLEKTIFKSKEGFNCVWLMKSLVIICSFKCSNRGSNNVQNNENSNYINGKIWW